MAEALKIEIDVSAARTALQNLSTEIKGVGTALSGLAGVGTKELGAIARATAQIKPIDAAVMTSFTNLATAAASLTNLSNLKGLTAEIKRLGELDPQRVVTGFKNLKTALDGIRVPPGLTQLPSILNGLNAALRTSAAAANQTATSFKNLGAGAQSAHTGLGGFSGGLSSLRGVLQGFGVALGAVGFANFIKGSFDAVTAMDRFNNTIKAVSGSNTMAAQEFNYVSSVSKKTATDISALTGTYGKFSAAAQLAGASLADTHKIFESVTGAARVLKLSGDDLKYTFLALEQMFSKGKVSTEELRRQFGERIPGAFALAAKAMGVTTGQLDTMLRKGEVVANDLLPKLADEMNKAFGGGLIGAVQSAQAAFTNFTNSVFYLSEAFGRKFFDSFKEELNGLSEVMGDKSAIDAFAAMGQVLGTVVAGIIIAIEGAVAVFKLLAEAITTVIDGISFVLTPFLELKGTIEVVNGASMVLEQTIKLLGGTLGILIGLSVVSWLAALVKGFLAGEAAAVTFRGALLALAANPILLGTIVGITAIALLVDHFHSAADAARELQKSLEPTDQQLVELSPAIKMAADSAKEMADGMGLTGDAAAEFVSAMTRAAATPEDLTRALKDNIQTQEKWAENLKKAGDALEKQLISLIANSIANGTMTDAMKENIQTGINNLDVIRKQESTLRSGIAAQKGMIGATQQSTVELHKNAQAVMSAADANGDLNVDLNEMVNYMNSGRTATDASTKSVSGFFKALSSGNMSEGGLAIKPVIEGFNKVPPAASPATEAVKNFKNETNNVGKGAAPLGQFIEDAAQGLLNFLSYLNPISPAAAETADGMRGLGESAQGITDPLNQAGNAGSTAGDQLGTVGKSVGETVAQLIACDGPLHMFHQALGAVNANAQKLTDCLVLLAFAADKLGITVGKVGGDLIAFSGDVTTTVGPVNELALGIERIMTASGPIVIMLPTMAGQFIALGAAFAVINPALTTGGTAFGTIKTAMDGLAVSIPTVSAGFAALSAAFTTISGVIGAVVTGFSSLSTAVDNVEELKDAVKILTEEANSAVPAANAMAQSFAAIKRGTDAANTGCEALNAGLQSNIDKMELVGQAVDRLISKYEALARAAKAAMDAANDANRAAGANESGGGGDGTQRRYGGYSDGPATGKPVSVTASDFSGAPMLASGISNTNKLLRKMSGGGIPTILHPNEAVVPLPKGRSIPVDLNMAVPKMPDVSKEASADTASVPANMTNSIDKIAAAINSLSESIYALADKPVQMTDTRPKKMDVNFVSPPQQQAERRNASTRTEEDAAEHDQNPPDQKVAEVQSRGNNIFNIEIRASDYDSFKRSEDQIARDLGTKIVKATRRIGGR